MTSWPAAWRYIQAMSTVIAEEIRMNGFERRGHGRESREKTNV
jgi:hypothetical protein